MKIDSTGQLRWSVLVLDDDPEHHCLKTMQQRWDVFADVESIGGTFQELLDALVGEPRDPDIVLVDMKWDRVRPPQHLGQAQDVDLPGLDQGLLQHSSRADTQGAAALKSFIANRLWVIADAVNHKQDWLRDNDGLPTTIPTEEVGIWIAGLASQLFPNASLFLFSTYVGDLNVRREIRQWLGYRDPPIRLLSKNERLGLDIRDPVVLSTFETLQCQTLRGDARLRLWAQSSVWLRLLLGEAPSDCRGFSFKPRFGNQAEEVAVKATDFFMQLLPDVGVDRTIAFKQVFRAAFPTEDDDGRALATVHAIFHILESGDNVVEQRAAELESLVLPLSCVAKCCTLLKLKRWDEFANVIYTVAVDGTPYLKQQCGIDDEPFPKRREMKKIYKRSGPKAFRPDPDLTVQALSAIHSNHDVVTPSVRRVGDSHRRLILELGLDLKPDGFSCLDSFKSALKQSIATYGSDRGYPRFLLWAVQSGAKSIRVRFRERESVLFGALSGNSGFHNRDQPFGLIVEF